MFTVQRKTFVPMPKPVIPVVGEPGVVIVPVPLVRVHTPVAGKIKPLPAMVVVLAGEQSDWSGPAFATGLLTSNTKTIA